MKKLPQTKGGNGDERSAPFSFAFFGWGWRAKERGKAFGDERDGLAELFIFYCC